MGVVADIVDQILQDANVRLNSELTKQKTQVQALSTLPRSQLFAERVDEKENTWFVKEHQLTFQVANGIYTLINVETMSDEVIHFCQQYGIQYHGYPRGI